MALVGGSPKFDVVITSRDEPGLNNFHAEINTDFRDTDGVVGELRQFVDEVEQHLKATEAEPRE